MKKANSRVEQHRVAVIDFGSQYTRLIARRLRSLGVYSEIIPYFEWNQEKKALYHAVVLSGGPSSVTQNKSPRIDIESFLGLPTLAICYGHQFLAEALGGKAGPGEPEFGRVEFELKEVHPIFKGLPQRFVVWMSHSDQVLEAPPEFKIIGKTERTPIAAMVNDQKKVLSLQFHPEVAHTENGTQIIENWLSWSGINRSWDVEEYLVMVEREIRRALSQSKKPNAKILCAVSGGVDSTTLSFVLQKFAPGRVYSVFVNHGLLRKNEEKEVIEAFQRNRLKLDYIDASKRFLKKLKGVKDPEKKRKIIGKTFIEIFEDFAKKHPDIEFLAQGTLYPDVIESGKGAGASVIKSHHNVGGLPRKLKLKLIEPFRFFFKDEVRELARKVGVPDNFVKRHPFPGPGLAIRIIGPVTEESLKVLREADSIFLEELKKWNLYDSVWQAFAVLLPVKTVGVKGDARHYGRVIVLRSVNSVDGMTADCSSLPLNFLKHVSSRITNEIPEVTRVVYDLSSKPPATIEWE